MHVLHAPQFLFFWSFFIGFLVACGWSVSSTSWFSSSRNILLHACWLQPRLRRLSELPRYLEGLIVLHMQCSISAYILQSLPLDEHWTAHALSLTCICVICYSINNLINIESHEIKKAMYLYILWHNANWMYSVTMHAIWWDVWYHLEAWSFG